MLDFRKCSKDSCFWKQYKKVNLNNFGSILQEENESFKKSSFSMWIVECD